MGDFEFVWVHRPSRFVPHNDFPAPKEKILRQRQQQLWDCVCSAVEAQARKACLIMLQKSHGQPKDFSVEMSTLSSLIAKTIFQAAQCFDSHTAQNWRVVVGRRYALAIACPKDMLGLLQIHLSFPNAFSDKSPALNNRCPLMFIAIFRVQQQQTHKIIQSQQTDSVVLDKTPTTAPPNPIQLNDSSLQQQLEHHQQESLSSIPDEFDIAISPTHSLTTPPQSARLVHPNEVETMSAQVRTEIEIIKTTLLQNTNSNTTNNSNSLTLNSNNLNSNHNKGITGPSPTLSTPTTTPHWEKDALPFPSPNFSLNSSTPYQHSNRMSGSFAPSPNPRFSTHNNRFSASYNPRISVATVASSVTGFDTSLSNDSDVEEMVVGGVENQLPGLARMHSSQASLDSLLLNGPIGKLTVVTEIENEGLSTAALMALDSAPGDITIDEPPPPSPRDNDASHFEPSPPPSPKIPDSKKIFQNNYHQHQHDDSDTISSHSDSQQQQQQHQQQQQQQQQQHTQPNHNHGLLQMPPNLTTKDSLDRMSVPSNSPPSPAISPDQHSPPSTMNLDAHSETSLTISRGIRPRAQTFLLASPVLHLDVGCVYADTAVLSWKVEDESRTTDTRYRTMLCDVATQEINVNDDDDNWDDFTSNTKTWRVVCTSSFTLPLGYLRRLGLISNNEVDGVSDDDDSAGAGAGDTEGQGIEDVVLDGQVVVEGLVPLVLQKIRVQYRVHGTVKSVTVLSNEAIAVPLPPVQNLTATPSKVRIIEGQPFVNVMLMWDAPNVLDACYLIQKVIEPVEAHHEPVAQLCTPGPITETVYAVENVECGGVVTLRVYAGTPLGFEASGAHVTLDLSFL